MAPRGGARICSKWNDLKIDDSGANNADEKPMERLDGSEGASGAGGAPATTVSAGKPVQAAGSAWNMNSWHYEERNWSKWGKDRLNELLDKADVAGTIGHDGLELELGLTFELTKSDGDSTTNIRKGKKIVIYDYELRIKFKGSVRGGDNSHEVSGVVDYELTVDDDEPDYTFKLNEDLPFKKKIETAVLAAIAERCRTFVKELTDKGGSAQGQGFASGTVQERVQVGQYNKFTAGPDGVANLQASAAEARRQGIIGDEKMKHLHNNTPTL